MKPETNSNRHFLSLALGRLARACLGQHAWRALDQQERPKFRITFLHAHTLRNPILSKDILSSNGANKAPRNHLIIPIPSYFHVPSGSRVFQSPPVHDDKYQQISLGVL